MSSGACVIDCMLSLPYTLPCRWGVPPEVDLLSAAIQQGGGIVDKVYKQWGMFPGLLPVYNTTTAYGSGGPHFYSDRGNSC
jgi:hypothetical protein